MINKILIHIHPRISCNACTFARLKQLYRNFFYIHCGFESHYSNTKEDLRHSIQTIVLNVYKYFKDEAMKFRPNHPQRSYAKKTPEATDLPQRTFSVLDMLHVEPHVFYDKFLCCSLEIHYAMFYSSIFHGCKKGNFKMKNCDLFLIFAQNIDCGYSLRVPTIFVLELK